MIHDGRSGVFDCCAVFFGTYFFDRHAQVDQESAQVGGGFGEAAEGLAGGAEMTPGMLLFRTIVYGGSAFFSAWTVILFVVGLRRMGAFVDSLFAAMYLAFAWAMINFGFLFVIYHGFNAEVVRVIDGGQLLFFLGSVYTLYILRFKRVKVSEAVKGIEDSFHGEER